MTTIGVIGAGYWGTNYLRVLDDLPQANLRWCVDLVEERLDTVRDRYPEIGTTTEYSDIIDDVDAVCIATPPQTHEEIAIDFLTHGVGVLVEKPLALTEKSGQRMVDAASKTDTPLLVGHIFEYHQAVRDLRNLVSEGDLGDLHYLHAQRTGLGPIREDVSALWDLCPHDVSIFTYLLDSTPTAVQCIGHSFLQDVPDAVYLFVEFENGIEAAVQASWLHPEKTRQVTLIGDEKMAVFDDTDPDRLLQIFEKTVDREQPQGLDEFQFTTREGDVWLPYVEHREPLKMQAEHFIDCVEGNAQPFTDGREGLEVVKVLQAAERSLENGGTRTPIKQTK